MSHANWLRATVNPAKMAEVVSWLDTAIRQDMAAGIKIEAIAVRGVSGAVIGGALSLVSGIPLIIVRKPHDGAHSPYSIEFSESVKNYVFVDDLIASGNTFRATCKSISESMRDSECVGIYLYADSGLVDSNEACGVRCRAANI